MDLMMEINKGIKPLPAVTSLLYLIKKQVSLCCTLYLTHTHTHCHMLPPRKKTETSVSMGTRPFDDAGEPHSYTHTKSHTIVFCILVTRLITSHSFNGGCVYLRESSPCVCVYVCACIRGRQRERESVCVCVCVCGCQIPDQMAKCQ